MFANQLYASPYRATWYMTTRCNLKCPHCYVSVVPANTVCNELSFDDGKLLLNELMNSHIYMINFAGGEPLLNQNLLPLATYARSLGMTIQIATNGLLLENIGIDRLLNAGFKCVQISLDGITEELHETLRGKDTFNQTLNAIRACVNNKLPVILSIAIYQFNKHILFELYKFARRENIFGVKIQPIITPFRLLTNSTDLALQRHEVITCINEAVTLFSASEIQLSIINQHILHEHSRPCNQDLSYAIIFPTGNVGICDNNESIAASNILDVGFNKSWEMARSHWHANQSCCYHEKESSNAS